MTGRRSSCLFGLFLVAAVLSLLLVFPGFWEHLGRWLFPGEARYLYQRESAAVLVRQHLFYVLLSCGAAVAVGMTLGVVVTRPFGSDFRDLVNSAASMGQTFPPVAVLALSVPLLGFGTPPLLLALVLYSVLPVVRNTIAGIESVDPVLTEAARGLGMGPWQVLARVELPLSLGIIMAGVRTAAIINVGTATLGATVGAGGLGVPIISGLVNDNPALILQGALLAALLAILVDRALDLVERR
ncbi:MAG: ABC transporter permease [Synergistales bacterium]|nr:ABC transporter permease [Synergistales bacterium]